MPCWSARRSARWIWISTSAYPLPVAVIGDPLGVPPSDRERLKAWSDDATFVGERPRYTPDKYARAARSIAEMHDYWQSRRPTPGGARRGPGSALVGDEGRRGAGRGRTRGELRDAPSPATRRRRTSSATALSHCCATRPRRDPGGRIPRSRRPPWRNCSATMAPARQWCGWPARTCRSTAAWSDAATESS